LATDANQKLIATSTIGDNLLQNTTVAAGSYTNTNLTVNAQGIITAASNGSASGGGNPFTNTSSPTRSATTTEVDFFGNASSTEFTATSTAWLLGATNFGSTQQSSISASGVLTLGTPLGLSSGGTNASLSGANEMPFMNAGNTALALDSHLQYFQNTGLMIGTTENGGALLGTSTLLQMSTSTNNFAQAVIANTSNGADASADFVLNGNLSTNTAYYGDLFIDGSGYSQAAFNSENAGDTGFLASDGALLMEAASSKRGKSPGEG
jgi:hypothetical protein